MLMSLSPEARALLPTDEEVAFYREHGYYVSRKIFTEAELDAAVEGSERFYRGERDHEPPPGMKWKGWTPEQGDVLRKNDWASLEQDALAALVRKPVLGAIAARLAGAEEIRLWHDQLLYKPIDNPDKPANVGWHTDKGYWKTCTSENMLTAWIPFHDCDGRMGTISMVDGSHLWPDNTKNLDFFSSDLAGLERHFVTGGHDVVKVPVALEKGQVSFHHCLTIHGSGPNKSDRPRRSIAVHLQDGPNRWREYRGEGGGLASHGNDFLVRKDAEGNPDYTDPLICPSLYRVEG